VTVIPPFFLVKYEILFFKLLPEQPAGLNDEKYYLLGYNAM
jgi:hypothetical protein